MTVRQKYNRHGIANLQTFTTGLNLPAAVQYLFNQQVQQTQDIVEPIGYPEKAIVRLSIETSDKSFIESVGIQQAINSAGGSSKSNTKVIVLFLEMPGYTKTYAQFINPKSPISKDDYHSSLLKVVLPPIQSKRVPVNNEIVLVDYDDPTDYTSIKFAGYPSELIKLDPKLSSYTKLGKASGKNAFKDAKGQQGV
tara:strand:+ start:2330 stop:2914 length:585 start_codon:yes stop_codon:yes gene_type:complete